MQIIGQICAFEAPFGGLGAGYDVNHRLIGKRVVDFLLVIIELYSLGVMIEALRANIDWKSPFLKWVGHFGPNSGGRGHLHQTICAQLGQ